MGLPHYFGPCTPPGPQHHYTFVLIATDLEPGALQPGMTREDMPKALDGHVKGSTGIIATFQHPNKSAERRSNDGRSLTCRASSSSRCRF